MVTYRAIWDIVINKDGKHKVQAGTHFTAQDIFFAISEAAKLTFRVQEQFRKISHAQVEVFLTDIVEFPHSEIHEQSTIEEKAPHSPI